MKLAPLTLLLTLAACFDSDDGGDGRRDLVELNCPGGACVARWDGGEQWSTVIPSSDLDEHAEQGSDMWACDPDPDVDICVIEPSGHRGCFRIEGAWAVAIAPACASPWPDGETVDVGNGMVSRRRL